jgi:hypothetical protein
VVDNFEPSRFRVKQTKKTKFTLTRRDNKIYDRGFYCRATTGRNTSRQGWQPALGTPGN